MIGGKCMNYGRALEAAKVGDSIQREGWNGKGQYVFATETAYAYVTAEGKNEAGEIKLEPFMILRNVQGKYVPWVPSQSDQLTDDWKIAY
jgi:hypothetical protein